MSLAYLSVYESLLPSPPFFPLPCPVFRFHATRTLYLHTIPIILVPFSFFSHLLFYSPQISLFVCCLCRVHISIIDGFLFRLGNLFSLVKRVLDNESDK